MVQKFENIPSQTSPQGASIAPKQPSKAADPAQRAASAAKSVFPKKTNKNDSALTFGKVPGLGVTGKTNPDVVNFDPDSYLC